MAESHSPAHGRTTWPQPTCHPKRRITTDQQITPRHTINEEKRQEEYDHGQETFSQRNVYHDPNGASGRKLCRKLCVFYCRLCVT
jgi:hypothetical protein